MGRPPGIPSYREHKPTGKAIVVLPGNNGTRTTHYLGAFGSPQSRAEYDRVIAAWLANGKASPTAAITLADITINELLLQYITWAEAHYRRQDGQVNGELANIKQAIKPVRELYGHTIAKQFGPLALMAVQEHLANLKDEQGERLLCRSTVNAKIKRIRRVFKWAMKYERLPATVYHALTAVDGLRYGISNVRETDPVKPVPPEVVAATLPYMPAPIRAMVQFQLLTGCRPGEAMTLRATDIDTSNEVWQYRPQHHKNKWRGHHRAIPIGPQAQAIIKPFMTTNPDAFLFSPRASVADRNRRRSAARKTKRQPSQLKRRPKPNPKRRPGERYNRRSYHHAVTRAIDKTNAKRAEQHIDPLPYWTPLQLRHTAATTIREQFGVEAAQVILGHSKVETTQIYAERSMEAGAAVAKKIG